MIISCYLYMFCLFISHSSLDIALIPAANHIGQKQPAESFQIGCFMCIFQRDPRACRHSYPPSKGDTVSHRVTLCHPCIRGGVLDTQHWLHCGHVTHRAMGPVGISVLKSQFFMCILKSHYKADQAAWHFPTMISYVHPLLVTPGPPGLNTKGKQCVMCHVSMVLDLSSSCGGVLAILVTSFCVTPVPAETSMSPWYWIRWAGVFLWRSTYHPGVGSLV